MRVCTTRTICVVSVDSKDTKKRCSVSESRELKEKKLLNSHEGGFI